jgi:uncharacterized Fe-S cluster-containing radical SAM superfamily protein
MLGCNLRCAYCWVVDEKKISQPGCQPQIYPFQQPDETYELLKNLAKVYNLRRVRVSGCEPLINERHLLRVIRLAMSDGYDYVLDTNGLLLTEDFLASIKPFKHKIYIYIGLKGSTPQLFQDITTADAQFWYKQLEALRLVVKHGFTLGVNLIANVIPSETLEQLRKKLYQISPILPMTVDLKQCTFFIHNTERMKRYGLTLYKGSQTRDQWNWILSKNYDPQLVDIFQVKETSRAFDNYELQTIYKSIEWNNGLKFIRLPDIPFSIPFSDVKLSKL